MRKITVIKKIRKPKKTLIISGVCIAISLVAIFGFLKINKDGSRLIPIGKVTADTNKKNIAKIKSAAYTGETSYDGGDVPYQLFARTFQKSDSYVSNKELAEKLSEEDFNKYTTIAASYIDTCMGSKYKSILADQESFKETLYQLCTGGEIDNQTEVESLMEWYIDNKVSLSTTFKTDKSLVYEDNNVYYVRGSVSIKFYSNSNEDAFSERYGIELKDGEECTYMCEIALIPTETPTVWSFSIEGEL